MTSLRRSRVWVALALALVLTAGACTSGDSFDPLPKPEGAPAPATSTTTRPDFSGVALAPVAGSTSTTEVTLGPGPSTVAGRIDGPDGPVENAVVRVERLVGDASASVDVPSGPGGTWAAPEVMGGRYRIRAWRTPDLAMTEPQIVFVRSGETAEFALAVDRFESTAVETVIAPDPPGVNRPANLAVRVSSQVVDENGIVRATPTSGQNVVLTLGSGWQTQSSLQGRTGTDGTHTYRLECRQPAPGPLTVRLSAEVAVEAPQQVPGSPLDPTTTTLTSVPDPGDDVETTLQVDGCTPVPTVTTPPPPITTTTAP